ncbi:putative RNA polymerase II subunit B1 CTD phosphatase RPAP2 [Cephus cinctus]|uniref:RNA polymerase II subunit B1 CTD phosphatase RPAP2 homolog n=1 Tax=Cephus cinctus TaxID=211228 RepID=A0AAJ7CCY9_CEPCN|nr:putative RNA polymerase II subunit B1 CTD phosphatase RPAP2 [Cephus cinctus]XP_015607479.1 putative RNA polymerase II subunit B1 CTD phosphatase RPAP2 [Cephus cinctus]XP_015607487.1 putative RNA polymerase II subunit B1 CTD phosphatase RPAP2 [Cephus cinctus]XP_015607495.1 putative RNA polymerase II subunit B1 CTD phosphatase RPAP2 [Cephus cinctus]
MNNSTMKSCPRKNSSEGPKMKKKMSKAQMQLALIKKKQCDAKALMIVERLLEPNVDSGWLLQNLGSINRCHMEDAIEERAIVKQCGYVLCDNSITVVINQRYHISTKSNKIYDVSKRKNFCSSRCYGAANYLLEQLLTSPLWLREIEQIPKFQLLPLNHDICKGVPGEIVDLGIINLEIETDKESNIAPTAEIETKLDKSNSKEKQSESCKSSVNANDTIFETRSSIDLSKENFDVLTIMSNINEKAEEMRHDTVDEDNTSIFSQNKDNYLPESIKGEMKIINAVENMKTEGTLASSIDSNIISINENYLETDEDQCERSSVSQEIINSDILTFDGPPISESVNFEKFHIGKHVERNPDDQLSGKKSMKKIKNDLRTTEVSFEMLLKRVENRFKEWITGDTLCLLLGEEAVRQQTMNKIERQEKYTVLCKKLNRIQLEEEREDKQVLEKAASLKPLPHFSELQKEGRKMQLKVRAFIEGRTVIEIPEKTTETTSDRIIEEESTPVLPLLDVHAPSALRRRILLDKLNRILPDLLRALAGSDIYLTEQYANSSERSATVKALVNTFSLSASNIVFKTIEWTLVGLIFIKLLSLIDSRIKFLLSTEQASMYTSMILMSYKLEPFYLDRLVARLTNTSESSITVDEVKM